MEDSTPAIQTLKNSPRLAEQQKQKLPYFSTHAKARCQERKLSRTEIAYVLENGRMIRKTGICFYFLGDKDLPLADRELKWAKRLVGATVLVNRKGNCIITVYNDPEALQAIKRKTKYRRTRNRR